MITIYTDGSAHPNPGPGGYGVAVVNESNQLIYARSHQTQEETTNNREELKAILWTMLNYGSIWGTAPIVYSDSAYCVNTLNDWMFGWAKRGWIKSDKQTPENLDLIQAYYDWYQKGYRINLQKIKGHAGHEWNELADRLATGAMTAEEAMKNRE